MFDFFEQMAINTVLGIFASLKKNPLNNPKVTTVIQHVVVDGCEVLGVTPPTFPATK